MRNGHLDSVSKVLESFMSLMGEIQCIHIVNALSLEKQTVLSSRSIRSSGNSVESGLDTRMTCYQKTAITSVMSFVKDLVCPNFLVNLSPSLSACLSI